VDTSNVRSTRIVGANVAVVAIHRHSCCAGALVTAIAQGAKVTVIARCTVVNGSQGAGPCVRVAKGCEAGGVGPLGIWAGDDGCEIDDALHGEGIDVADQCTIANVSILERGAIGIFATIAGQ